MSKIRQVSVNQRKKTLEIETTKSAMSLPFSRLNLKPTAKDKIKSAIVDGKLSHRAVTYVLESGKEDSVHLDAFLDYNRDPDFMRNLALHDLTVQTVELVKKSGLSKHELTRRLKTSPSQLYRLLDTANYKKSVAEMLRLLAVLGYRLDVRLVKTTSGKLADALVKEKDIVSPFGARLWKAAKSITAYAHEYAGTPQDLDRDLEAAATEQLVQTRSKKKNRRRL